MSTNVGSNAPTTRPNANMRPLLPSHCSGGPNVSPEGKTNGLTHTFVMSFASEADRDTYLTHPAHVKVRSREGGRRPNLNHHCSIHRQCQTATGGDGPCFIISYRTAKSLGVMT